MSLETASSTLDSTDVQKEFARITTQVNLAFRQFVQRKLKQHQFDLTFEMLQVLGQLWEKDGVNQQELARATQKDKVSLTYLIDNLHRRELVYRQEDLVDRRNKLIFLTSQGRQLRNQIVPWVEEMYIAANAGIPQDEFKRAMQVLRQVTINLKNA